MAAAILRALPSRPRRRSVPFFSFVSMAAAFQFHLVFYSFLRQPWRQRERLLCGSPPSTPGNRATSAHDTVTQCGLNEADVGATPWPLFSCPPSDLRNRACTAVAGITPLFDPRRAAGAASEIDKRRPLLLFSFPAPLCSVIFGGARAFFVLPTGLDCQMESRSTRL